MARGPPHPGTCQHLDTSSKFHASGRMTRVQLTGNVPGPHGEYETQPRRTDQTRPQANREEEDQARPPVPERLQPHDGRYRHGEYPQVGGEVGRVGEVGKRDLVDAGALRGPPPHLDGAAARGEDELHDEDPGEDEGRGGDDEGAEEGVPAEDAVVEREDGEFGGCDAQVIEVAKDVVGLEG